MKERHAAYKYNILSFFLFFLLKFVQVLWYCFEKISHNLWKFCFIHDCSGKWIIFLINKSWIVFKYLINNQSEKENILKIRKFVLFIYLL